MQHQSIHNDVLAAPIPDSAEGRERFLAELKDRAKGSVGAKAWPDAQKLYEKCLKVVSKEAKSERAILYANLSLVQSKMGRFEDAKLSAVEATKNDKKYVKGWWRLGQAFCSLELYSSSLKAFETAYNLDPNNSVLAKEYYRLRGLAANPPKKADEAPKREKADPLPTKSTTSSKPKKSQNSSEDAHMGGVEFSKSEVIKGYKTVNGKKTSYFHNELSAKDKELIGDIAPKKLDAPAPLTQSSNPSSTSVWNQAGTWEEKDVTKWAQESLKELLGKTTYILPPSSPVGAALARVSKVSQVSGHASVATVRGKKRYIYEFIVKLEWALDVPDLGDDAACGKMCFPDFDGTCELGEPYDIAEYEVTSLEEKSLRPVADRFVKNSGLRDALHATLDGWVHHFREKY